MKLIRLFFVLFGIIVLNEKASAQCPIVITTQPKDTITCENATVTFTMAFTGLGIKVYSWQYNNGAGPGWQPASGSPFSVNSNPTRSILTITGTPAAFHGYRIRCIGQASCSPISSVTSDTADITVYTAPIITETPTDTTVCENSTAAFFTDATGQSLVYQWQAKPVSGTWGNLANGGTYSGVNTKTLVLTGVTTNLIGYAYRCFISGQCNPPIYTDSGVLQVRTLPTVNAHPVNKAVCQFATADFTCAGSGTGVTYQWQEDKNGSGWVDIPGAPPYDGPFTNILKIYGVDNSYNGAKYRCKIAGACTPTAFTNIATLTVNASPVVVSMSPVDTVCEGDNVEVSVTATGTGLVYQWQEDSGPGWNNIINNATYTGATTDKLKIQNIPYGNNGYLYRAVITGTCTPSATSDFIELFIVQDKNVFENPKDTFAWVGDEAIFKVKAVGSKLALQWQVDDGFGYQSISNNNPAYSGVNNPVLKVKSALKTMDGYKYRCLLYGGCQETPDASEGGKLSVAWPLSVERYSNNTNNITVYPNPAKGSEMTVKLTNSKSGNYSIRIIDQLGRTLHQGNSSLSPDNSFTINIGNLPAGVYALQVSDMTNTPETIRFTKE